MILNGNITPSSIVSTCPIPNIINQHMPISGFLETVPLYQVHGIPLPIITGITWQGFHLLPLYWFGCRNIYTNCAFKLLSFWFLLPEWSSSSHPLLRPFFQSSSVGGIPATLAPAPLAWLGRLLWYGPLPPYPSPISEMVLPAGRRSNDSACLHLWVCVQSSDGARWMKTLFCDRPWSLPPCEAALCPPESEYRPWPPAPPPRLLVGAD